METDYKLDDYNDHNTIILEWSSILSYTMLKDYSQIGNYSLIGKHGR